MNKQTYDIREFTSEEKAREAGYELAIKQSELADVTGMNRQQRRAWASQQRKAGQ